MNDIEIYEILQRQADLVPRKKPSMIPAVIVLSAQAAVTLFIAWIIIGGSI